MPSAKIAAMDDEDLRRRISALEDRWSDIESGKSPLSGAGKADWGPNMMASQFYSRMTQYYTEGNQSRVANPGPLGLYAFGYTTALLQGFNTRWVEKGTNDMVYCHALFLGGLTQLLAGMWELYRNNLFGGTAFSCYGSFWLAFGTFGMTSSGGIVSAPAKFPHGMQMFLSLWGILTAIFFAATLVINVALQVLFFSLMTTFFLLAAGETGRPNITKAAGYMGYWTAFVAFYIGTAELLNTIYRRQILPLGVVGVAKKEPSLDICNNA